MDRCALFVDAGYVLADGAMAVHGTSRRESVTWDYAGLLQLLGTLAMERSRLPLLRCYWYEATVEGRRSADHDALAALPGVKLRLAKTRPGRREGVESQIHRDLTTLARNKAVSDAMVVSAEEDLAQVICDVQDMGVRVTLLGIDGDAGQAISHVLRQECDDFVEISSARLRPYVELITGAEPPRADERGGMLVALRPVANGNGNGHASSSRRDHAEAPAYQAPAPALQPPAPQPPAPQAAQAGRPAVQEQEAPHVPPVAGGTRGTGQREPAQPGFGQRGYGQPNLPDTGEAAAAVNYPSAGEQVRGGGYGKAADFSQAPEYGAVPDFMPAAARADLPGRGDLPARPEPSSRTGTTPRSEATVREDRFAAPPVPVPAVPAVPGAPLGDQPAERPASRPRPEPDLSGYNPGAVREQFSPDAATRDPAVTGTGMYQSAPVPVPVGPAQARRLPAPGAVPPVPTGGHPAQSHPAQSHLGQNHLAQGLAPPGQPAGPVPGPPPPGPPPPGPSVPGPPAAGAVTEQVTGPQSGGQPVAPALPIDPNGATGFAGAPGDSYGGGGPMALVGQPPASPGSQVPPGPAVPGVPVPPGSPASQQEPGHAGPVGPVGVQPPYPGGQANVSLADAVQSAHEEGREFGESVARDAPALWLEAVLARKPRMPSDLEARLLQGSSLPIDFLLHDEVRHALRRGFWDALERARR